MIWFDWCENVSTVDRVLPLQPQKTLDTDLSAPEFQESVKIYQVIRNTVFEMWPDMYLL